MKHALHDIKCLHPTALQSMKTHQTTLDMILMRQLNPAGVWLQRLTFTVTKMVVDIIAFEMVRIGRQTIK